MGAEYALFRRGPLTMAPSQLGAVRAIRPGSRARQSAVPYPAAVAGQVRRSASSLPRPHRERLQSATREPRCRPHPVTRSTATKPFIAPNYLATEEDRRSLPNRYAVVRRDHARACAGCYRAKEYQAGPRRRGRRSRAGQSGRRLGTTIFHPVGTAKMDRKSYRRSRRRRAPAGVHRARRDYASSTRRSCR